MKSKNDPLLPASCKDMDEKGHSVIASKCTRCGACLSVCPVYDLKRHERFSPRGREKLLSGLISKPSRSIHPRILETLEECLQCGACSAICQSGVDVCALVRKARGLYPGKVSPVEKGLEVMSNAGLRPLIHTIASKIPPGSGLFQRIMGIPRKDSYITSLLSKTPVLLDERVIRPKSMKSQDRTPRIAFFLGCIQNFLFPEAARSIIHLLDGNIVTPREQGCCGLLAWTSGHKTRAKKLIQNNINALEKTEADIIVTGCASCAYMIKEGWPALLPGSAVANSITSKVMELSEYLAEFSIHPPISEEFKGMKAALHVPCHQKYGLKTSDITEGYLKKTLGKDYRSMKGSCCGQGGSFALKRPELSAGIWKKSYKALERTGPDILVTTCSGCLLQWKARMREIKDAPMVLHLAQLFQVPKS